MELWKLTLLRFLSDKIIMKLPALLIIGISLISTGLSSGYGQILPAPTDLTCETLRLPAESVVTDPTPDFGWVFPQSGNKQSAYRRLVASSPQRLHAGTADLWDSG